MALDFLKKLESRSSPLVLDHAYPPLFACLREHETAQLGQEFSTFQVIAELAAVGPNFEKAIQQLFEEITRQGDPEFSCSALEGIKVAFSLRLKEDKGEETAFAQIVANLLLSNTVASSALGGLFTQPVVLAVTSQILSVLTANQPIQSVLLYRCQFCFLLNCFTVLF